MNENIPNTSPPAVIAIDGISGSGKSSTAKEIANRFGMRYVDTGAMYRVLTHSCLAKNLSLVKEKEIIQLTKSLEFSIDAHNQMKVNGKALGAEIRSAEVSANVSDYCKIAEVRKILVEEQRKLGNDQPSVVDGRDIGTVVFPESKFKFFFWASPEVRAERRFKELQNSGLPSDYAQILNNLKERDEKDTSRANSPLKQAEDAQLVDTSNTTFEGQVKAIMDKIRLSPDFNILKIQPGFVS